MVKPRHLNTRTIQFDADQAAADTAARQVKMRTTSHLSSKPVQRGGAPRRAAQIRDTATTSLPFLVLIFMLSLVVPVRIYLGSVLLMPYRVALLVALVPCLIGFVSRRSGRIIASDVFIVLFWMWACVAIVNTHGWTKIEGLGLLFLETVVPYLCARVYIRNAEQFRALVRLLFRLVVVLLPFAIYESLTADPILLSTLRKVVSVPANVIMESRMGLDRAQVTFEHPILFGIFAASSIPLSIYVINWAKPIKSNLKFMPTGLAAVICSMSTGALLSFVVQTLSTFWDRQKFLPRNRWTVFFGVIFFVYVIIDVLSNRNPFQVFISYMTLNPNSSGWRLLIWDYGSAEVWRHPLFGIGFNDWIRPWWMHTSSVDNFWLMNAMRYGLPGFILLSASIFLMIGKLAKLKNLSGPLQRCRNGYLICLGSLMVSMCTVHIWGATYVWFMFLLGSATWLKDAAQADSEPLEASSQSDNLSQRRSIDRAASPFVVGH